MNTIHGTVTHRAACMNTVQYNKVQSQYTTVDMAEKYLDIPRTVDPMVSLLFSAYLQDSKLPLTSQKNTWTSPEHWTPWSAYGAVLNCSTVGNL